MTQPITGAGPWQFDTDTALATNGGSELFDFPNMKYNGSTGWFRKMLPFDDLRVINESNERVTADINGIYEMPVPGNSIETFGDAGIQTVRVINESSTADIAAGDVTVAVAVDAYGQDDVARQQAAEPNAVKMVKNLVGLR